jgi:hypothetical protein
MCYKMNFNIIIITCWPMDPAPVYAIRQRAEDNSQSFTRESFPDERRYLPVGERWG